jgi:hypothetical protein
MLMAPPSAKRMQLVVTDYKDGFAMVSNDSLYYTRDGDEFVARKHNFGIDFYRLNPIPSVDTKDLTYLVSSGGGEVYKFDKLKDTILRLDNSYRFMSRFGEASLSVKDTIYSYGGYGEFSYDDKLIAFKENFREWNVVPIEFPLPSPRSKSLIQYDSIKKSIFTGLGAYSIFQNGVEVIKYHLDIIEFSEDNNWSIVGSFENVNQIAEDSRTLLTYKNFEYYRLPMLYSNWGIWTFDFKNLKAYHHYKADKARLQQYTDILAYNRETSRFLMGSNMITNDPRYHVVNEVDLLGLEYREYDLNLSEGLPGWAYGLIGASLFLLIPLFRTRTFVGLDQAILKEERKIQQQLSSEDFFILKRIVEAFPEYVEYPELQNSYEKDLSYESRIKKLRASIKEIDEVVQKTIGRKRNSIFEIEKGREDKRVKVIRIKDDSLKKTDFFGRLRRGSK